MKAICHWLSEKELETIYTSAYWNDIEAEKRKPWWIADGDYDKCLEFLKKTDLLLEYEKSEKYIGEIVKDNLKVADLAAGIGWTSALLSKIPKVSEVHSVEISKHRLDSLFEHSVKMMAGEAAKISRYLGSFYELKFANESIDVVYMSQAFHHAESPLRLLVECDRVLRKEGTIVLVGEHYIGVLRKIRRFLVKLLRNRNFTLDFYELFPPDSVLGDHYYRYSDYRFMFTSLGYTLKSERVGTGSVIYVARKGPAAPR